MPTLPPDSDPSIASTSLPVSPREAAMQALVYRRTLRQKPGASGRRIAGWVGTILIHVFFLFAMVLGPAYVPPPPPPEPESTSALQVRLIDKPPPPKPPARGTPSRAPVVQTLWKTKHSKASSASSGSRATAVASAAKTRPAVATPAAPVSRTKPAPKPAAPPPSVEAVAQKPPVPPKAPPRQPDLERVPIPAQAPPDLAVDTPKPQVVPPRFQPEPVRKPQVEGTAPMPPPASLAIPPTPASQMAVTPETPQITSDRTAPVPTVAMTLATVPRPEVEASSAPPTPQDTPLPAIAQEPSAPPAPQVTPVDRPVPPKVAVEAIRAPAVETESELEAVPLPDAVAKPTVGAPDTSSDRPVVQAPAVTPGELQRPVAGADASPSPAGEAPGANAAGESTAQAAAAQGKAGEQSTPSPSGSSIPSAPGVTTASASGSNTPGASAESGKPGAPTGVEDSNRLTGANGTSDRADGVAGGQGDKAGQVGAYTELKPRGDVTLHPGAHVHVDYQATRFDKDWTPKNESSVDTAIRRAADKATVHFTVPLPRGLRLNCVAGPGSAGGKMNAISLLTLGCGGDPPPKPDAANASNLVKNQTMAPSKPLAPDLPPADSSTVASAPVAVDNAAFCATARVAGGPLPAACAPSIKINVQTAPSASGSWVPASDQFK